MESFQPKFKITNELANLLSVVDQARGFLDAAKLSPSWLRRMSEQALLLEAHHTTHIEGTHLTIHQAERAWAGEHIEAVPADDVRELLNYRDAFELVSQYLESGEPVTENLIREIHRRLVEGVRGGQGGPGQYRQVQNYVANDRTGEILYTPPAPYDVPPLMRELVEWLNMPLAIHPVLTAGIAQFQLVHIHPFMDGNGRTSRLLSTLCLYRSGYDFKRLFTLSEFYDRDRRAFYSALQSVREAGLDLTGWLEFFVTGLATQLQELRSLSTAAFHSEWLAAQHALNDRQTRAMEQIISNGSLRIQMLEELFPGISRRTLQRDMGDLAKKDLVVARGGTNNLEYALSAQVPDQLATNLRHNL